MPAIAAKIISYTPNSSLFSLLKYFNLEQYYDKLLALGMEDANPQIQFLRIQSKKKFINRLN